MLFRVALPIVAVLFLVPIADGADAQARLCRQLDSELSRLGNGGGNAKQYRRYDRALRKKAIAYNRVRARYDATCRSGFLGLGRRGGQCGRVLAQIDGLKTELRQLERMRNRYARGADHRQVRRIRSAMRRAGCGRKLRAASVRQHGGNGEFLRDGRFGYSRRSDTFRTMCVRSCDGFYFPVSFSTTRERFSNDEQACQAACPGTNVSLYVHRNPGEGPEQMVSTRGDAYASLPTAFKYRKTFDQSCSCGSATQRLTSLNAKLADDRRETLLTSVTAVPAFRPRSRPGAASVEAEPSGDVLEVVTATHDTFMRDGKRVRIVGPAHWSVRSKEEALLIPVPMSVR